MNHSRQNNELIGNSQGFTLGDGSQKKWETRDRRVVKRGSGKDREVEEKKGAARKIG